MPEDRQNRQTAAPTPHLSVELRHRIGALDLNVRFQLTRPWTVLFGPSGSGKSTILRAIAGIIRPDHAHIVSTVCPGTPDQKTFVLVDTDAGIFIPPHKRVIRLAAQQPSLFPHLTVLQNLKYGMNIFVRDAGEEADREQLIQRLLDGFRIADLAGRFPSMLSGGQAQRVVLARTAAATGCRLMLLDEPFNGLDLPLRDELIDQLRRSPLTGSVRNILSVTHDVAEAFQLDAEVIQLADGRVCAQGPAPEVLRSHRERLLAQLAALNAHHEPLGPVR